MTSGNDYVLQVKGNQPKLRAAIQAQHQAAPAPARDYTQVQERRSGAICTWQVSSYACADPVLQTAWAGLARTVVVVKTVVRGAVSTRQTRYYITSLRTTPVAELAAGIRGHWGIENKLHRARDVQFKQDTNGIRHPLAAVNVALFNTLSLNYLLLHTPLPVSYTQVHFAQNFKQFLSPHP
ncbi:hypothetical protein GCM10022408_08790 [Hymenobacter fastidiosus]|uniref:ISAs1 family transposase n=1 Tax=Hymenobacter fastidiosus TaxID=486264 RepID=A0ABP7RNN8_9BACT